MMMTTKISFRLQHPTLDLAEIAKEIGLPIARIWTSGKERRTLKGDPLDGVYQWSYCAFKVTEAETISAAIVIVDAALQSVAISHATLQDIYLKKSLYCTLMGEGEIIDKESLGCLVKWGIQLEIDGNQELV